MLGVWDVVMFSRGKERALKQLAVISRTNLRRSDVPSGDGFCLSRDALVSLRNDSPSSNPTSSNTVAKSWVAVRSRGSIQSF